jgi:hypothetical protein
MTIAAATAHNEYWAAAASAAGAAVRRRRRLRVAGFAVSRQCDVPPGYSCCDGHARELN